MMILSIWVMPEVIIDDVNQIRAAETQFTGTKKKVVTRYDNMFMSNSEWKYTVSLDMNERNFDTKLN